MKTLLLRPANGTSAQAAEQFVVHDDEGRRIGRIIAVPERGRVRWRYRTATGHGYLIEQSRIGGRSFLVAHRDGTPFGRLTLQGRLRPRVTIDDGMRLLAEVRSHRDGTWFVHGASGGPLGSVRFDGEDIVLETQDGLQASLRALVRALPLVLLTLTSRAPTKRVVGTAAS